MKGRQKVIWTDVIRTRIEGASKVVKHSPRSVAMESDWSLKAGRRKAKGTLRDREPVATPKPGLGQRTRVERERELGKGGEMRLDDGVLPLLLESGVLSGAGSDDEERHDSHAQQQQDENHGHQGADLEADLRNESEGRSRPWWTLHSFSVFRRRGTHLSIADVGAGLAVVVARRHAVRLALLLSSCVSDAARTPARICPGDVVVLPRHLQLSLWLRKTGKQEFQLIRKNDMYWVLSGCGGH